MTPASRSRRTLTLESLALAVAVIVVFLPLAWTLLAALGVTPVNGTRPPSWVGRPSLASFVDLGADQPAFWQAVLTSIVASSLSAALTIAVAVPAAWALAGTPFMGRSVVINVALVLASLPAMAFVIPLHDLARFLGLAETLPGLVLAEAAVNTPLALYVLAGAMIGTTAETEDAAALDGAGLTRILARVVVPRHAGIIAATGVVVFVIAWNMLLVPLVLAGGSARTVPVALIDFFWFERELEWPTAAAALVVSLVPVALLVLLGRRVVDRLVVGAADPE